MRKILAFCFFCILVCTSIHANICDAQGNPSPPLLALLHRFGITHDGSWETIISQTQLHWMQNEGKERWELSKTEDPCPKVTFALFTAVGMTRSIHSPHCCYDYALVLGATTGPVKQRYHFLKEEWDRGVRFNKIVILTGDRIINPKEDMMDSAVAKNETEMMQLLFKEMDLPSEWQSMVEFVDTPNKSGRGRPDTVDTFLYWLKENPMPGRCLVVSSQPFVYRQAGNGRNALPASFTLDGIGLGFSFEKYCSFPYGLTVLLDDLARWIFTEKSPTLIGEESQLLSSDVAA